MRSMRALRRDPTAATAIEYAIIAGLIGLGLVGSLVTTRGSLSAVFGTAATKMASGSATTPASTSSRAGFWASKTLAGPPVTTMYGRSSVTRYTYTDGTVVEFGINPGASNAETLYVTDPVAKTRMESFQNADGSLQLFNRRDYAPDMSYATRVATAVMSSVSNGAPTLQNVATYSAAFVESSSVRNVAADAAMTDAFRVHTSDAQYFHDVTVIN